MDFNANLNEVLKYGTEEERKSFEKNIDDNPLESTNHTVYADWLEEQGDHSEAAFRRSVGEWVNRMRKPHPNTGLIHLLSPEDTKNDGYIAVRLKPLDDTFPDGVSVVNIPGRRSMPEDPQYRTNPIEPVYRPDVGGGFHWAEWRHMEEAFRQAFKAGRKEGPQPPG